MNAFNYFHISLVLITCIYELLFCVRGQFPHSAGPTFILKNPFPEVKSVHWKHIGL